ncbi:hypothetical protein [Devosia sp.]|uniref:hypothetical protein n=1 Tax=Devosia sp. TaxID=1871048 RepID=UPI00262D962D|nr:hypothetical protein [Devosia sp.]
MSNYRNSTLLVGILKEGASCGDIAKRKSFLREGYQQHRHCANLDSLPVDEHGFAREVKPRSAAHSAINALWGGGLQG